MTNLEYSRQQQQLVQRRLKKISRLVEIWSTKLKRSQSARLATALLLILSLLPFTVKADAKIEFFAATILLLIFSVLVYRTRQLQRYVRALEQFYIFLTRQNLRLQGLPSQRGLPGDSEEISSFKLIPDLGLLGSHSLWTLVDETLTEGGQRRLLEWMSQTPPAKEILEARQRKIKALRSQTWFYTRLCLQSSSRELNLSRQRVQDFLQSPFVTPNFIPVLLLNMAVWLITVGAVFFFIESGKAFPPWILIPFPLLSLTSLGAAGAAFKRGVGLSHHLSGLAPLLETIEKRASENSELAELCPQILKESPSRSARRLEFILGFLGTETNPILHFLLNALIPWSLIAAYFAENLRKRIHNGFPPCLEELAELEVIGSLLILDRYQTQDYPQFSDSLKLQCRQIYHPLLVRSRAVANDFSFPENKSLGLLTGSNMSGKSTFLRTLGLNQILANMGAPVFADHFETSPYRVETCIEVSDSLRDGHSYFYAEVRRLRDILERAATGVPVLYLIDEIFRGTNNRERQIGSRAVIRSLAQEKSAVGFISTHDLELTSLGEDSPRLLNLHFREDIDEEGKMVFSYHLRPGPCPTTNALIIMAAEGIKVEV